MPTPRDGVRERDPFAAIMWHILLVILLALALFMLPGDLAGVLAVFALIGWMAGSSVVRAQ